MFSNNHELFQQLRKAIFKCLVLKAKISLRCKIYLSLTVMQMRECTVKKEETMDDFYQEMGSVGSTAAGRVERKVLQGPWWKWSLWRADTSTSEKEKKEITAYSCSQAGSQ